MSKQAVKQWENRIVGHGEESPENLLANPLNFRVHPKRQQDALQGVLDEVGVVDEVIVNQRTGFLVNGHLRVALAMRTNQPAIPVKYVDLSESEEALILATFDPISALATTDKAKLDEILADVQTGSAAVQEMLAGLAESAGLYLEKPTGAGGDEFDTAPEDGPTRTRLGDLWQLGEHRLLVGDCTVAESVARLMDGQKAEGIFTSPPYAQQRTYEGNMSSDWRGLVTGATLAALAQLSEGGQAFVNLGLVHREGRVFRYWDAWLGDLEEAGWPLFGWYVWDKLNAMPGDWGGRLAPAHEWIFHFAKSGERPAKTVPTKHAGGKVGRTQRNPDGSMKEFTQAGAAIQPFKIPDSVIRLAPQKPDLLINEHPAPFPLGLPESFLAAWRDARAWYDPFLGSGTTLIACERLNRKCYGCEIEPRYADVILRRWEAETCQEAVLLERLSNDSTL